MKYFARIGTTLPRNKMSYSMHLVLFKTIRHCTYDTFDKIVFVRKNNFTLAFD